MAANPTIRVEEKQALVDCLVKSLRLDRRERAAEVLTYLFERHLADPSANPTQSEIFNNVWSSAEDVTSPGETTRKQIIRLRKFLLDYSPHERAVPHLRLHIPVGRYQLVFSLSTNRTALAKRWLWGAYLRTGHTVFAFLGTTGALVQAQKCPPSSQSGGSSFAADEVRPFLEIYRRFIRVTRLRDLELLASDWNGMSSGIRGKCGIYIGDDMLMSAHSNKAPEELENPWVLDGLGWASSSHFRLSMLRWHDSTIVLDAHNSHVHYDTETKKHVLLTRFQQYFPGPAEILHKPKDQTLICARSLDSILAVATFITSKEGMLKLEESQPLHQASHRLRELSAKCDKRRKEFEPEHYRREEEKRVRAQEVLLSGVIIEGYRGGPPKPFMAPPYKGGAPPEFQVLFSVRKVGKQTQVSIEEASVPQIWVYDLAINRYRGQSV